MVSFTPTHIIAGKTYAGSPNSWFGTFGKETNLLLLPRIEPRFLRRPARSLVTMPMTLSGLPLHDAVSSKYVTYVTVIVFRATKQHGWM